MADTEGEEGIITVEKMKQAAQVNLPGMYITRLRMTRRKRRVVTETLNPGPCTMWEVLS